MTVAIRSGCPTNTIPIKYNCTVHTTAILQWGNNGQLVRKLFSQKKGAQVCRRRKMNTSASSIDMATSEKKH